MYKKEYGKEGERRAEEFLKKNGFRILEKNFRSVFGEIDIIAVEKDTLVFIEVKARSSRDYGLPEEAVGYKKIEHIKKAAGYYRIIHPNLAEGERIDVLAIETEGKEVKRLELIRNVTG